MYDDDDDNVWEKLYHTNFTPIHTQDIANFIYDDTTTTILYYTKIQISYDLFLCILHSS